MTVTNKLVLGVTIIALGMWLIFPEACLEKIHEKENEENKCGIYETKKKKKTPW